MVLDGRKIWSLALREEQSLRVFKYSVLRNVFCPKVEELRGHWRKLHNEELQDLYCSHDIIKLIK